MGGEPKVGAYAPHVSARRPGGSPRGAPKYRVLVHRKMLDRWNELVDRVGLESAEQFWDHVANDPGHKAPINGTTVLKGSAGNPKAPGFSRTVHYEVSGAARINFQYHDQFRTRPDGDPHKIVVILTIDYSSH